MPLEWLYQFFFLNLCPKKYHTFYIFLHRAHNRNLLEAEIKCFKSPNLTPSPLKNLTSPAKKYQHQEYYLRKKITTNYHFKIITTSQITCFFPINHSKWLWFHEKTYHYLFRNLNFVLLVHHIHSISKIYMFFRITQILF